MISYISQNLLPSVLGALGSPNAWVRILATIRVEIGHPLGVTVSNGLFMKLSHQSAGGAADVVPTRWTTPGVNLRRVLHVGSWNVLSLRGSPTASFIG